MGQAWAVVVAGGSGSRFGAPKQFADLAGRPVLEWSLDVARQACAGVVLVVPLAAEGRSWPVDVVVTGGATRSESVRAGLAALPRVAEVVVVHDAARPLAPLSLWRSVIAAVEAGADAAVPGAPVTDTVKEVGVDGSLATLDRSRLVAVQTPQAFRAAVLNEVHAAAAEATDDAALVEAAGGRVAVVPGPAHNIKITSPLDLVVASALLAVPR
ncbi:MAG: 2-C-methyl-D-erythritol 4-phosphate cytidylyltransferase [Actinomycetota bacterium]|nr:2-C-methyl-D-erythritol 4-phosphate cytidylyltransferase [Actinomycetota bacterium]